jgi:hypothetical protein
MAKWVDQGEQDTLEVLFVATSPWTNTYLGMYTDSTEPGETATLPGGAAPITEVSGAGYSRKTLARGTWSRTGDYVQYAQQTFTASGGSWSNVYGYFIATTLDNTGKLLCVEHFTGGPFNVPDGGSIKITPKITCA